MYRLLPAILFHTTIVVKSKRCLSPLKGLGLAEVSIVLQHMVTPRQQSQLVEV